MSIGPEYEYEYEYSAAEGPLNMNIVQQRDLCCRRD